MSWFFDKVQIFFKKILEYLPKFNEYENTNKRFMKNEICRKYHSEHKLFVKLVLTKKLININICRIIFHIINQRQKITNSRVKNKKLKIIGERKIKEIGIN